MIPARQRAILEQLIASDPGVSAFVEASAGSGKTKLLTDRILRLMLAGAPPGRIQCLTFTKAAAAEMALRLQHRLGEWATADDASLDRALAELRTAPGRETRRVARELFAQVLDLPGGMRIGTIHAFCQSLLRRFPLEAAISPHFQLVEDAEARVAMEGALESVLAQAAPAALQNLAGLANAERLGKLVQVLDGQRDRLAPLLRLPEAGVAAVVRRTVGAAADTEAELLEQAVSWPGEAALAEVLQLGAAHGSDGVRKHTQQMLGWLRLPPKLRTAHWADWLKWLLKDTGGPRVHDKCFANPNLAARFPQICPTVDAEQARVQEVEDQRRRVQVAEVTTALLLLAFPMLRAYAARKSERGLLDYTDLIGRTSGLLQDPGAAWVLYKLDGGIDHLLLDEVQDTAPEQWQIAHRLTEEFFAGLGAHAEDGVPARTFFAVGDPKQSIYSFQGADPDEFIRSRARMAERVGGSGKLWRDVTLDVSFRSTAPILHLVDTVFADPLAAAGVVEREGLHHFPDRLGDAGRVELWPLAPLPERVEPEPWTVPEVNGRLVSAPQKLADAVAGWIARATDGSVMLEGKGRALAPGDVLVLVRKRTDFAATVVRALKAKGVPVAGLDRLELTEQAAVQDVLAACDAVLLPEDDLAVGCVLTSPLGGLTDDGLMALALGRPGRLWDALRQREGEREEWAAAWHVLSTLQTRADHVTPHALLAELLGPLGGRARLLARLGPEAAEPLDELLNAALDYTRLHAPSLQGFLHWVRRSGATVKREAGGTGGAVRVMTVHGAKGLQAPVVVLPDTTGLPPEDKDFAWCRDPASGMAVPLWAPNKDFRCAPVMKANQEEAIRGIREYNRLLYVALTRAEDRLVIAGWQTKRPVNERSWYRLVERAFERLGARREPIGEWGEGLVFDCEQTRPAAAVSSGARHLMPPLPAWAGRPGQWRPAPPPPEPPLPTPLAPSRPEGATFGPVPGAASPLEHRDAPSRRRRGTLVHELLQHLPSLDAARWDRAAVSYLSRNGLDAAEADELAAQTLAVLRHPALAALFGPEGRAEQPVTGLVGGVVVSGKVDRMAVLPDRVLLADYKSGRAPPRDVAATPVLYLRQLAAYRAVLQAIYRDRPVDCALVWTRGAVVAALPPALLDAHAPGSWGAALPRPLDA
ncbi:MAG: double-strand break repair helicase AddA [Acetobacteraceae bacterium]